MTTERVDIIVNESGARVVKRNFDDISKSAEGAGVAARLAARAFAAVTAAMSVHQIAQYADVYNNMQNRLKQVTTGTENLASVTDNLFKIANQTRSSFEGTAELYARVALATRQYGFAQQDLLTFTKRVNEAIILSGASGQEASAGLIQLAQGLASGTLRGDELRSVLEQLPAVADVIAKHLGVTRGELRLLGQQGKLVAKDIIQAFLEASSVETAFATTTSTISQAWEVLKNHVTQFIGEADRATGATATFAQELGKISDAIDFKRLTATMAGTRAYIQTLWEDFPQWFGEMMDAAVTNAISSLSKMGTKLRQGAIGDAETGKKILDFLGIPTPEYAQKALDQLHGAVGDHIEKIYNFDLPKDAVDRQASNGSKAAQAYIDAYQLVMGDGLSSGHLNPAGPDTSKPPGLTQQQINRLQNQLKSLVHAVDPVTAAYRDWTEAQKTLSSALGAGMINLAQYNDLLAKAKKHFEEGMFPVQKMISDLARQREALGADAQTRERLLQIYQLEDRLKGNLSAADRQAYDDALKLTQAKEKEAELYDEIRSPMQNYMQQLDSLAAIQGKITDDQYTQKLRDINLEFLKTDKTLAGGVRRGLLEVEDGMNNVADVAEKTVVDAFSQMTDALTEFFMTGKLGFTDMVNSILQQLTRLAVQQAIINPLSKALGLTGSGTGEGLGNLLGGVVGNVMSMFGDPISAAETAGNVAGLFGGDQIGAMLNVLPSHAAGGYTGAGGTNQITGLVHGQEYVVNADATRLLGLGFLDQLNSITGPGDVPLVPAVTTNSNSARPVVFHNNWNINTPDAESFKMSRAQIMRKMNSAMSKASEGI